MYLEDFEKYNKLKTENVPSILSNDLPEEFSIESFKTVDEFIKKTRNLDYEWVIYFDYVTGEMLRCGRGKTNTVVIVFENDEFDGKNIASIHNHPDDVFSPPSGKNFGILMREFEKYELIATKSGLWILKAKCIGERLMIELNVASVEFFKLAWNRANILYSDEYLIDEFCDMLYGALLSKYINDKNINDIQLTKKEYNHDY